MITEYITGVQAVLLLAVVKVFENAKTAFTSKHFEQQYRIALITNTI